MHFYLEIYIRSYNDFRFGPRIPKGGHNYVPKPRDVRIVVGHCNYIIILCCVNLTIRGNSFKILFKIKFKKNLTMII